MAKDYYSTLGVSKSASQDEVKAAFRKLAHQHHPDKPTGDEAKFKEANEAYQVLGDAEKRAKYDQFGSSAFDGSGGGGGGGQSYGGGFDFSGFQGGGSGFEDLGDIFGSMFGGGGRQQRARRGSDVQVDVEMTFKEAVFGVGKEISVTKQNACDRCGGVGAEPGTDLRTCEDCSGAGVKIVMQRTILGNMQSRVVCPSCDGAGEVPKTPCTACKGNGTVRGRKTITVNIPPGVDNGNVVRVRGEGEAMKGAESGDLLMRIHVKADRRFEREGDMIFSAAQIGFTQAALGDSIDVETVDGPVTLKIPAGTQSGSEFRLRGKGVTTRHGRGDHLITVSVITPKKLNKEQKKLLEELDLKEGM